MAAKEQLREARRQLERAEVQNNAELHRANCKSLKGFINEAWKVVEPETPLKWNWHMDAICEHLGAVTRGEINRLLMNVPPGSSKSLIVSVLWPAWEWGPMARPGLKYVSTAFNDGPVKRDTRKTRDLILSDWYQDLWPNVKLTRTGETSFANNRTGTREGISFGSLTSQRGDRLIIDDPHSTETAESEAERNNTTRKFREGALNRLNDQERSAIVIIMQRLHQDDVSGVILQLGMPYVHLCLPMRYEIERHCATPYYSDPRKRDGDLLDPGRFPRETVDQMELDMGDYAFAGQYQQRPAPRGGGMFKTDRILMVDLCPPARQIVRGWDIAGSTRKTSPFTVGVKLAEVGGIVYICDVRRLRAETNEAEDLIVGTCRGDWQDNPAIIASVPQDPGQAGKSQRNQLAMRLTPGNFKFSPETGKKEDRAIPIASMVNAGLVRMLRGDWNKAFIDELSTFPFGSYKDQVDALSRAYAEITIPTGGSIADSLPIIG